MPSGPSRQNLFRNSFLRQVFEASQVIAQQFGFDAIFVPIVGSLVAPLILISLFITLLVWLRYLVMVGLISSCVIAGARRKRKQERRSVPGDEHKGVEGYEGVGGYQGIDGYKGISQDEHNLEVEDLD